MRFIERGGAENQHRDGILGRVGEHLRVDELVEGPAGVVCAVHQVIERLEGAARISGEQAVVQDGGPACQYKPLRAAIVSFPHQAVERAKRCFKCRTRCRRFSCIPTVVINVVSCPAVLTPRCVPHFAERGGHREAVRKTQREPKQGVVPAHPGRDVMAAGEHRLRRAFIGHLQPHRQLESRPESFKVRRRIFVRRFRFDPLAHLRFPAG